jgi:hypothetical protein
MLGFLVGWYLFRLAGIGVAVMLLFLHQQRSIGCVIAGIVTTILLVVVVRQRMREYQKLRARQMP